MPGAIPSLTKYVLVALRLVKHRNIFNFSIIISLEEELIA